MHAKYEVSIIHVHVVKCIAMYMYNCILLHYSAHSGLISLRTTLLNVPKQLMITGSGPDFTS